MNALDTVDFPSKTRSGNSLNYEDGVTLEFLSKFMRQFAPNSIGMDLSDVNFEVTTFSSQRHADEQTFRELFELTLQSINGRGESNPLLRNDFTQDSLPK
jgi:hypothetical protein